MWSACLPSSCPLGAGGRGTLAILLTLAKMDKIPSFCLLSRFALGALYLNMALFRVFRAFLARFGVVVWVCVVRVLCVACGALYACGVRRIKGLMRVCSCFSSFAYLLLPFVLSLCSCFCPFVLLCFGCLLLVLLSCLVCFCVFVVFVVSFSLSDYTQKERAQRFCPCVLSLCVVGCFILLLLCTLRTRPDSIR